MDIFKPFAEFNRKVRNSVLHFFCCDWMEIASARLLNDHLQVAITARFVPDFRSIKPRAGSTSRPPTLVGGRRSRRNTSMMCRLARTADGPCGLV